MPVVTRSQTKKLNALSHKVEERVKKNEPLYYLLTEPLVNSVDKDAPRKEDESYEDYIKRRGLPPLNRIPFDNKNESELMNYRCELMHLYAVKDTREKQFEYLTYRWDEYDRMMARQNDTTPYANEYDKGGYTPLHRAVYKRDLALVKELLQVPGIDVNLYNSNAHHGDYASKYMSKITALGISHNKGYTEITYELLQAPGINTNKLEYIS